MLPKSDLSNRPGIADPTSGGIVSEALTAHHILCHSSKTKDERSDHK